MLDRDLELREFFARKWKLLRVHSYVPTTGMCSCGDITCTSVGKHPMTRRGVWDAKAYTCAEEIGHCNIGVACGTDVVVLDIDERNGGLEKLAELETKHGKLPSTWVCATGGGGLHYYFAPTKEHHRPGNALKSEGVELKGVGNYVLAPTSLHASNRFYEWDTSPENCELAPLPTWIENVCESKFDINKESSSTLLEHYLESDLEDALCFINSDCSYVDWIKVGMALKASGFSIDLWDRWSSASKKYPGRSQIERKWASFHGESVTAASVFYLAKEHGWEPKKVECLLIKKEEAPTDELLSGACVEDLSAGALEGMRLINFPPGTAGTLAEVIEASALHCHRQFAIASALSILSALVQGSYSSPYRKGYLGSYMLLIAGASAGKEHYSSRVTSVIRSICPQLVMGVPQSPQALRADLHECNSRVVVMDEGLRWLQGNSESKSQLEKNLVSDIMSIWGMSAPLLPALATKKKADRSPEIEWPHLSIIGCGTTEKLETLLRTSPAFVEDGTLSRFDFIVSDYSTSQGLLNRPEWYLGPDLERALRTINQTVQHKDEINAADETKLDRTVYGVPQPVQWCDEVARQWESAAMEWIGKSQCEDKLAASVWNRAAEKALRVASCLAVVDSPVNPWILEEHMTWALEWQTRVASQVAQLVVEKVGQSDQQLAERAIVSSLEKGVTTLGQMKALHRCLSRLEHRVVLAAIDSLIASGAIERSSGRKSGSIKLTLVKEHLPSRT